MKKEFKNGKIDLNKKYLESLINAFEDAIKNNLNLIYLGYEIIDDDNIKEYNLHKNEWEHTLNILLNTCIKMEEYELCAKIKKLKNQLNFK